LRLAKRKDILCYSGRDAKKLAINFNGNKDRTKKRNVSVFLADFDLIAVNSMLKEVAKKAALLKLTFLSTTRWCFYK